MNASPTTPVPPARRAAQEFFNTYQPVVAPGGPRFDVGSLAVAIERATHTTDMVEALARTVALAKRLGAQPADLADAEQLLAQLKGA